MIRESFSDVTVQRFNDSGLPEKICRWPDSNRHGPFTAQRILSPLRLPFRHIGAARPEFNLVLQPAKMNFAV